MLNISLLCCIYYGYNLIDCLTCRYIVPRAFAEHTNASIPIKEKFFFSKYIHPNAVFKASDRDEMNHTNCCVCRGHSKDLYTTRRRSVCSRYHFTAKVKWCVWTLEICVHWRIKKVKCFFSTLCADMNVLMNYYYVLACCSWIGNGLTLKMN